MNEDSLTVSQCQRSARIICKIYRDQCHTVVMPVSRGDRRTLRKPAIVSSFGLERADAVLDLIEILELAWHDCYGEITPPDQVIDDLLLVSKGSIDALIRSARLAITDFRDLRVSADDLRRNDTP
jgi:hypothetical protein